MKMIVLFSTLFLLLNSISAAPEAATTHQRFRIPDFRVVSTEEEPTMDQHHALFELHFSFLDNSAYKAILPPTIELSCNGVIRTFDLDSTNTYSVEVSPGEFTFILSTGNRYHEVFGYPVKIEGGMKTIVECDFRPVQPSEQKVVYKPVIYTYSDQPTQLSLELKPKGAFTFTYPQYSDKWQGTAHPNGSFSTNGKTYPYLFWEGTAYNLAGLMDYSEGTVLNADEVIPFLEQQLTAIGFNDQEKTDFITFWGPKMVASERGFAHFLVNEEYDNAIAELKLQPQADHIYRLYLLWEPLSLETNYSPKPQELPVLERGGLTIVEWGGSLITY